MARKVNVEILKESTRRLQDQIALVPMVMDDEQGEEEDLGEDIEEESTAANFKQAVRDGDISPKSMDKKKSVGKPSRRQKKDRLMEPWQDINKLEEYRRKLGIHSAYANMNGKIWAFVDEDIDVDIVMNMKQQMTLKLFHRNMSKELYMILLYAKCDAIARIELWDSMYHLASDMESPWLVGGDFNVILSEEEKVYLTEVEDFTHCMDTCTLYNLGFKGSLYTWWNGSSDIDCIFKRQDRFFTNQQFLDLFPALEVEHLIKYGSDHAPLLLSCNIDTVQVKKHFKFLNFWTKHKTFLKLGAKETFGDIFKQVAALEDVIKVHEIEFELNPTAQNRAKLHKVEADLTKYYHLEEELWRQKAGMQWFKDGDRKTKFFHAHVRGKRKRLQVSRILDKNDNWIESQEEMEKEAVDCFQAQFTEERIPNNFDIINHVHRMISAEQNERMWEEPTMEEVKAAVYGLNGTSASGPDGFTGQLNHASWEVICVDV
ncbi:uncharacterized protein LOC107820507 [Nicotiana tabacum]|uniref:Uncharacterized protein LOC107820507 n=1 Tax=Nicotiana tabacum TaxID=4097 RepID=A0AC58SRK9_TOBAC